MSCFFTTTPPAKWNIISYLTAYYNRCEENGTTFSYNLAINTYSKRLGELKFNHNISFEARAKVLLEQWNFKGRNCDSARARKWAEVYGILPRSKRPAASVTADMGPPPRKRREPRIVIGTHVEGLALVDSTLGSSREDSLSVQSLDDEDNSSTATIPPDRPPSPHYGPSAEEDSELPPHFHTVLRHAHLHSTKKVLLSTGKYLEDILYDHARQLDTINLVHWWVVDQDDKAVMSLFPGKRLPVGSVMRLPEFPKVLDEHIKKYKAIVDRAAARRLAFETDQEWAAEEEDDTSSAVKKEPEMLYLKYWIDGCFEQAISLTTECSHLLHERLNEGSWEVIYSRLLDDPYQNLPALLLQRKEKRLRAHKHDPNPALPYTVCYDGIVHTRAHRSPSKSVLEFAVIEVKRSFDSTKWQQDLTKLVAGCRAILKAIRVSVDGHQATMAKVVAAGVLQAGARTMVVLMTVFGENVYLLRKGTVWRYPEEVKDVAGFGDLLVAVWKVREVVKRSYEAVRHYHECIKGENVDGDRTGADFL